MSILDFVYELRITCRLCLIILIGKKGKDDVKPCPLIFHGKYYCGNVDVLPKYNETKSMQNCCYNEFES